MTVLTAAALLLLAAWSSIPKPQTATATVRRPV
ncbi:UNVERIFIED_ORG: translation initiation factor 2 gamma subunit (eIF-2gamma) [Ensifer adhaerens]|nr:translation initiation factor 2 gamma subunit (eIF-2gamma) [Ensifer adhaerens]